MCDNSRLLTLAEFIDMRRRLEVDIASRVEFEIREFNRSTGTRVDSVTVEVLNVEPALVSVKVEVRL